MLGRAGGAVQSVNSGNLEEETGSSRSRKLGQGTDDKHLPRGSCKSEYKAAVATSPRVRPRFPCTAPALMGLRRRDGLENLEVLDRPKSRPMGGPRPRGLKCVHLLRSVVSRHMLRPGPPPPSLSVRRSSRRRFHGHSADRVLCWVRAPENHKNNNSAPAAHPPRGSKAGNRRDCPSSPASVPLRASATHHRTAATTTTTTTTIIIPIVRSHGLGDHLLRLQAA